MSGRVLVNSVCAMFCLVFCFVMSPTGADAWKVKTHVYSANLILKEVGELDGYVDIKPFGKIKVKPEYKVAILAYPEYFRAGTMAPDQLPDLIIGQAVVHPGKLDEKDRTMYSSGMIIDNIFDQINNMDASEFNEFGITLEMQNPEQRMAFGLGCLMHAAGDFFGHAYVNEWAGGSWPKLSEIATQKGSSIVIRHNAIEAYIDSKIPKEYKDDLKNYIQVPESFYYSVMVTNYYYGGKYEYDAKPEEVLKPSPFFYTPDAEAMPQELPEIAYHLNTFFELREKLRQQMISGAWAESAPVTPETLLIIAKNEYCRAWIEDIDTGLIDWVRANSKASQELLREGGGLSAYKAELTGWAGDHLLSMLGAPDVLADVLQTLGNAVDSLVKDMLPDKWQNAINQMKQDFTGYVSLKVFGIDTSTLIDIEIDPTIVIKDKKFFAKDKTLELLDREMGNFKDCTDASNQTFVPFDNTLAFMKLMLIGQEGVDTMRAMAGIKPDYYTTKTKNTMTLFVDSLDVGYKWGEPVKAFDQSLMTFYLALDRLDREFITYTVFNMSHKTNPRPAITSVTANAAAEKGTISVSYTNAPVENVAGQKKTFIGLYKKIQPLNAFAVPEAGKAMLTEANTMVTMKAPNASGIYQARMYDQYGRLMAVSGDITISGSAAYNKNAPPPEAPEFKPQFASKGKVVESASSWTGSWFTGFGPMEADQYENGVVKGTYGELDGEFNGKVSGNRLTGTFMEGGIYTGTFEMTMDNDSKGLTGVFKYDRMNYSNKLKGVRVLFKQYVTVEPFNVIDYKIMPVNSQDRWTGTWASLNGNSSPISLVKSGNNFTGTWCNGFGKISGKLASPTKFSGTYTEIKTFDDYKRRNEKYYERTGTIEMTLSSDFKSLKVRWKENKEEIWRETVMPKRYSGLPKTKEWTGFWSTRNTTDEWLAFIQDGNVVTGTFDPTGDNTRYSIIRGTVEGNKLTGVSYSQYYNTWEPVELTMSSEGLTFKGTVFGRFCNISGERLR